MNKIIGYVKAHPWTVGALAVGGIVVFMVIRGMGSSSGSTVAVAAPSGPSEDAQLAFASLQMQGQIAGQQASAALQQAQIEGDVAKTVAAYNAQAALAQIDAQKSVSLADIGASSSMFTIQNQSAIEAAQIAAHTQELAITSQAGIQQAQIASNQNIMTQVIEALKPAPVAAAPTPVAPAPVGNTIDDWAEYVNTNADLSAYYYSHPKTMKKMTLEEFGADHFQNYGQKEGRVGVGGVVYN